MLIKQAKNLILCRNFHKSLATTLCTQQHANIVTSSSEKRYLERKLIGYSPEQLFDVVANVGDYHKFLPMCNKSQVLRQSDKKVVASLEIGFSPIIESYISHVDLIRPNLITAKCIDGVLFNHLDTKWKFDSVPNNQDACMLEFFVSFEFKSMIYSNLAFMVFDKIVRMNVNAFLQRAEKLYGPQKKLDNLTANA